VICKQGVRGSSPLSSTPEFPQVTPCPVSLASDLQGASFRRRARCVPGLQVDALNKPSFSLLSVQLAATASMAALRAVARSSHAIG
jgi:hypothetical protein